MAGAALSIKLRCASWQQLATIYKRDLSRGSMFLKATSQPPIGTVVKIDLELPSATVIELTGTITKHVTDPQRGTGVDLKLEPLPTKSVWMIESALAADNKVRAQTGGEAADKSGPTRMLTEGEEVAAAEDELVRALEAEAESLRKLNPFLVLGVSYETNDAEVRLAFGELTKKYHPDRFARYQSAKLRQIAAEIFILIRDAYRRLADAAGRQQVIAVLGIKIPAKAQTPPRGAVAVPAVPPRRNTPPGALPRISASKTPSAPLPRVAIPPPPPTTSPAPPATPPPPPPSQIRSPHDAPTNPSAKSAELAHTELARADHLAVPVERSRPPSNPTVQLTEKPADAPPSGGDAAALEALIEQGKYDEALSGYWLLARKQPQDRSVRAGIELCEGLKALAIRDRLEAAQRFEAALELDPSNERAARELAEMRRQATNERKGLLSRLMGKKEPPP